MKNSPIFILFAALVLFLINGCSQSASKDEKDIPLSCVPANKLDGIVGGYKVSAVDPLAKRVVMLLMKAGKDAKLCTGTPISKDVILTAAHCLEGVASHDIVAVFHTDITCESGFDFKSKTIAAKDSISHPGYSGKTDATNDIALVKLSTAIPADYEVSEVYDGQSTLSSDTVTLAGYGSTNEDGDGSLFLRTITKSFKNDIEIKDQNVKIEQRYQGICTGDSGGPVFIEVNNKMTVAGVNSIVGGDTKRTVCHKYSVSMYTPYFREWIQTQLGNLR